MTGEWIILNAKHSGANFAPECCYIKELTNGFYMLFVGYGALRHTAYVKWKIRRVEKHRTLQLYVFIPYNLH